MRPVHKILKCGRDVASGTRGPTYIMEETLVRTIISCAPGGI